MQPKVSSTIRLKAERFKEICLNNELDENSRLLNDVLRDLFDPDVKLNGNFNQTNSIITEYIAGGENFDDFKAKS